jgi:hypothetical protein
MKGGNASIAATTLREGTTPANLHTRTGKLNMNLDQSPIRPGARRLKLALAALHHYDLDATRVSLIHACLMRSSRGDGGRQTQ